MSVRRIRATGGLATDPALTLDPEALRVASNVLLHRPGLVQPRFGLGDTAGIAARTTDRRPIAIVPFDGDLVIQSYDSINDAYSLERGSVATVYTGDVTPPDEAVRGVSSFAQARGSLYITGSTGVRKLADVADADTLPAGVVTDYVWPTAIGNQLGTDDRYAVAADSAVAYRYVWRSTDANGYLRRSAPSPRFAASNNDATDEYYMSFGRIYLPDGIGEGDVLEIYRTHNVSPATSDPGDEMYLAVTYTVTAADVALGYLPGAFGANQDLRIVDKTPDAQLGAALYTNDSQGTILSANERPPRASVLAAWGRCMWFGDALERDTMLVEPLVIFDTDATHHNTWRDGIHYSNDKTADIAFESNQITPSSVAGAKVGQYITHEGQPSQTDDFFAAGTKIAAIITTITIVDNAAIVAGTATPDKFGFLGLSSATEALREIAWDPTITAIGLAQKGATAADSATNLASAINQTFDGRLADMTAVANGASVVITDNDGHGVPIELTEATPGTFTVAYTIELTNGALDSGTGEAIHLHDYLTVDGIEFYFAGTGGLLDDPDGSLALFPPLSYRQIELDNTRAVGQDAHDMVKLAVREIAYSVGAYTIVNDVNLRVLADNVFGASVRHGWYIPETAAAATSLLLVRQQPSATAITASHSPERAGAIRFTPGLGSTQRRGRLWFSKPDEPEAVPPINFVDIGEVDRSVLALTPLRDALLVWKEDGLFRVTGSAPASWTVDEVDLTLRLLASQAVCVLEGVAYAWTNRGVVRVAESGVAEVISGPIGDLLRPYQQLLPLDETGHKRPFWAVAHERLGLVMFGAGATATDDYAIEVFVWHTTTQRWATWGASSVRRLWRCAAYDPAEDRMVVGSSVDAWALLYERSDEDAASSCRDMSVSAVSGTVDGTTVTLTTADLDGWRPAAGDVIVDASAVARRVTSVQTVGATQVATVDSAGLTGTEFTWHAGFASVLGWHAQAIPGLGARWSEAHVHFAGVANAYVTPPLLIGGYSERDTSASTVTATLTATSASAQQPLVVRVGLPRAIVRATHLYPRIEVRTAGALWRLAELDLHAFAQSQRVTR